MQQRLQAEIPYVKADDENILSYGEEDNADRISVCETVGFKNRGEYIPLHCIRDCSAGGFVVIFHVYLS